MTFQQEMEKNHAPKTLYFGDLKTAVAKEDGVVKYEVVYIDMIDDLVGGDGVAVGADVPIGEVVRKPLLGPTVSTVDITADMEIYEFTHQSGLAFSASGSKVRFANQLSADLIGRGGAWLDTGSIEDFYKTKSVTLKCGGGVGQLNLRASYLKLLKLRKTNGPLHGSFPRPLMETSNKTRFY